MRVDIWKKWTPRYLRPQSISTKLFAITSLLLIAFLTLLLVIQSNFFESYYRHKKMNQLEAELAAFAAQHYQSPADLNALPKFIPELEERLSATAGIMQLRDGTLTLGPQARTKAIVQMDKNGNVISMSNQSPAFEPQTLMPLMNALKRFRNDIGLTRQVADLGHTVSFLPPALGPEGASVAGVFPLASGNGAAEYALIAAVSLQPVGEAAGILKDFYVYFLLLAVAAILLLTYLYSRMITRPLKKLNNAASQMAMLDFTVRCDVRSQDELGSLGHTLNFLSGNLDATLRQLHSANEQLKADIEKEKQLEKQRREFVASVSHELKTPISLISGYAEGIKDGIVTGTRREEYIEVILDESSRMAGLVQDMLDLAQLESGKFKLNEAKFPLHDLIRSMSDKMDMDFRRRGIQCRMDLRGSAEAYGDVSRIGQVLANLLSNASKHTPDGGTIRIQTEDDKDGVQIRVHNNGAPIPDEELPRLWETFYTVEKSHNREHAAGSGLGLAIVRNILALHGSRYGVYNTADGVTFYFTLQTGAA